MTKEVALKIIRTSGSVVAMVIIWRLVEAALVAGIDGVVFFGGVAAVAGLGGYNIKWLKESALSKIPHNPSGK